MKAIIIEGNYSIPLLTDTVCYKSKKAERKLIRDGLELQLHLGGMVPSPGSSVISVGLLQDPPSPLIPSTGSQGEGGQGTGSLTVSCWDLYPALGGQ